MKIYIVGSLNMDLVVRAPFMPENGMTISGEGFMTNPGGKGANQAAAIAKLGGNAVMVGCVGEAFGDELINGLTAYGADTRFIRKEKNVSSGIAVIVVVDGDNRIILDAGANARVDEALIDEAFKDAEAGDYLVAQLEIGLETVAYALKTAKEKGLITVLNPAPAAPLTEEMFSLCDYFMPNQSETEFYAGVYPSEEASAKLAAETLAKRGVKNVVVTMGGEGSAYVGGGNYIKVPACKVTPTDTTAAGDTYVGAFVTRLSEGADVKTAMEFASRAAAVTVTRRGAQQSIPYRKEIFE